MRIFYYFILTILFISFYSCTQQKVVFLQTKANTPDETEYAKNEIKYYVNINDILQIVPMTSDKDLSDLFSTFSNTTLMNTVNISNPTGSNINGALMYGGCFIQVDDSGKIMLPYIGKYKVTNKTIAQLNVELQNEFNKYVDDTPIIVRLANFKITFVGEFGLPGIQTFTAEPLNIFDALAKAGGINETGNRKEVLVVRPTEKGFKTFRINLTKRELLTSNRFYVLPNDIIYAEPRVNKTVKTDLGDVFFYINTIATLVTTTLLILHYR